MKSMSTPISTDQHGYHGTHWVADQLISIEPIEPGHCSLTDDARVWRRRTRYSYARRARVERSTLASASRSDRGYVR